MSHWNDDLDRQLKAMPLHSAARSELIRRIRDIEDAIDAVVARI